MNSPIDNKAEDEGFKEALDAKLKASYENLRQAANNLCFCSGDQEEKELIDAAEKFVMARGAIFANEPLYYLDCIECGKFLGYIIKGTLVQCPHCGTCGEVYLIEESEIVQ